MSNLTEYAYLYDHEYASFMEYLYIYLMKTYHGNSPTWTLNKIDASIQLVSVSPTFNLYKMNFKTFSHLCNFMRWPKLSEVDLDDTSDGLLDNYRAYLYNSEHTYTQGYQFDKPYII